MKLMLSVFLVLMPLISVAVENGCEDQGNAIVCRSGPSEEEIELNRLRALTKEERSWEMLQNLQIKICPHLRDGQTINPPDR